jgi:hypothetical protein
MATQTDLPVSKGYLATIFGLMLVLPTASMLVARFAFASGADWWSLAGQWFVFWAVGVRLFSAGIKQVVQPGFTARDIFHLASPDAEVVVRELGFANICMGLAAVISGFVPSWRMSAGFVGGLYFGIAGVMHVIKKPSTPNEWIALVSDLFVFLLVASWLVRELAAT